MKFEIQITKSEANPNNEKEKHASPRAFRLLNGLEGRRICNVREG
jgi:hypothetical protein